MSFAILAAVTAFALFYEMRYLGRDRQNLDVDGGRVHQREAGVDLARCNPRLPAALRPGVRLAVALHEIEVRLRKEVRVDVDDRDLLLLPGGPDPELGKSGPQQPRRRHGPRAQQIATAQAPIISAHRTLPPGHEDISFGRSPSASSAATIEKSEI